MLFVSKNNSSIVSNHNAYFSSTCDFSKPPIKPGQLRKLLRVEELFQHNQPTKAVGNTSNAVKRIEASHQKDVIEGRGRD